MLMVRKTDADRASAALQYLSEAEDAIALATEQISPIISAGTQLTDLRQLQADAATLEDAIRTLLVGDSRLRLFRPVPNSCERVVEFGAKINEDKPDVSEGDVYKAPPDLPVIAPATMRIRICRGANVVYGKRIIGDVVGNERYAILLAHLSRVDVDEGDIVEAGTVIGAAGQTGNANFVQVLFALADRQDTNPLPGLAAPMVIGGSWINPWPYTVRHPEDAHYRPAPNAQG